MANRWAIAGVAGLTALAGGTALAQDTRISLDPAPAICSRISANDRVDTPQRLIGGWLAALPPDIAVELALSRDPLSRQVADANCAEPDGLPGARCALRRAALGLLANPEAEDGTYRLYRSDGRPVSRDQLTAFFTSAREDDAYPFHIDCAPLPGGSGGSNNQQAATPERGGWAVAGSTGDLADPLKSSDFATLGWIGDRQAGTDSYTIDLVIGAPWIYRREPSEDYETWSLRPALTYERSTSSTAASKDQNDLGFWLLGHYANRQAGFAARDIDLRMGYVTDDQFESRVLTGTATYYLPFARMNYYDRYGHIGRIGDWQLEALWRAELVSDFIHVGDEGEKTGLTDDAEYWRIGGDLEVLFQMRDPSDANLSSPVWTLQLAYQVRDGLAEDGGDAQMFSGAVNYHPAADSHFQIGLRYERGESLLSFTPVEKWVFGVGVRY
ncbi:hypothetical protein [Hyphobacterium marinum]|uniref:Uncharacterized protein n=1 Tax=Hyphobacterium marinum TaxID=3116574 RepID=A0ABU7LYB4_9PROT|nr:hypothetical protein [Hyphobacterium sp. Y6023]MEE2566525.1 hypothetical protein [Hyphobacterium sp. Y6023]